LATTVVIVASLLGCGEEGFELTRDGLLESLSFGVEGIDGGLKEWVDGGRVVGGVELEVAEVRKVQLPKTVVVGEVGDVVAVFGIVVLNELDIRKVVGGLDGVQRGGER
jgi:hypothetical protein